MSATHLFPGRKCWRCGEPLAGTTLEQLELCSALAAERGDPLHNSVLHYSVREIIEMWPADLPDLWEWLHRRLSGQGEDP